MHFADNELSLSRLKNKAKLDWSSNESLKQFSAYFIKQWFNKFPNWQICKTPAGYQLSASTQPVQKPQSSPRFTSTQPSLPRKGFSKNGIRHGRPPQVTSALTFDAEEIVPTKKVRIV